MWWRSGTTWIDSDADYDPDFAPHNAKVRAKVVDLRLVGKGHSRPRFTRQFVIRLLVIVLIVLLLGIVLDPTIGPLFFFVCFALVSTLAVMVSAMALGMFGFGLFAAGDRLIAWMVRHRNWPGE